MSYTFDWKRSRAPVLMDDDVKTVLTIHDVLVEIINIAEAHRLPPEELAKSIAEIHLKIYSNVVAAIREYPHDLDLLTYLLTGKSLKDVRMEPGYPRGKRSNARG